MENLAYSGVDGAVSWEGKSLEQCDHYHTFLQKDVAARLHDQAAQDDFKVHLRGLATTGFAQTSLDALLAAETPEGRDWAVAEALAEAWLNQKHGVIWPWNTERDKRTPKASLPGADLIGFIELGNETRLVFGEVKASSDVSSPPNVMNGRGGMAQQLETLATDLSILFQLLRYLQPRCKNSPHENQFNAAVALFLRSGNKAITIFGVLIRDTAPAENDLKSRAQHLSKKITSPSTCHLQALYLPHAISDLPRLVSCGAMS
ncbi:hypothetical protein [Methylicorpusculum sp.]|uniref:hypothetical protein n=1 Tax=Methylicorpusculum sp. TaxID=2713644 RepID=UPI0027246FE3|nr:hypothetical protein [Methylicorpusculum sp.]MDO8846524.1 hypothetical protein [Methylicorpusculum sp.]